MQYDIARCSVPVYHIYEDDEDFLLLDDLEIHYIELPKLNLSKQIDSMDPVEFWLAFIKGAGDEKFDALLSALCARKEEIKMAMDQLNKISADELLRQQYYAREKTRLDEISRLKYAELKGMKQGLEQGLEQGKREIAVNLLRTGMPDEQVSEITGISLPDIVCLRSQLTQ